MNNNQEQKARQVFTKEVNFIISILVIAASIMFFIFQMKQDIALLQQEVSSLKKNHLHTIKKDISEIQKTDKNQRQDIQQINLKLEKILTKLK